MARSLKELAAHVGGQIDGDPSVLIHGLAPLEDAAHGHLSFFSNARYRRAFEATRASAVLVGEEVERHDGVSLVKVPNPQLAFARLSQLFFPRRVHVGGVAEGAHVHPQAVVHPTATVMAGAVVERGARVGARAVLYPGVYVGEDARVGEASVLHPNAVVYERCVVGARCTLHAGSVVGADGFGFVLDGDALEHVKIPQAGIARVEDDVELGACACVDRATLGETVVGRGSKVDNLVQVGHNVRIGPLSILCAQAGVSGSTQLGSGVVLGGQVGIAGHLQVGDGVKIAAQSGVAQDAEAGATLGGTPATDAGTWKRAWVALQQLPELLKQLRALKKRVAALEGGDPKP